MEDNGVLKYYREHRNRNGFLKTKEIDAVQYNGTSVEESFFRYLKTPNGRRFYRKECYDKISMDAEIILSQIYARAGLKTAIYTPAIDVKGNKVALSNDVKSPLTIPAHIYYKQIIAANPDEPFAECIPSHYVKDFPLKHYLTNNAFRDKFKTDILDIGAENEDRHQGNYFWGRVNPRLAEKLLSKTQPLMQPHGPVLKNSAGRVYPAVVDHIVLYDYGESATMYTAYRRSPYFGEEDITYPNIFTNGCEKTREEMIDQLLFNPNVQDIMTGDEMAEFAGSVNPGEVARDIKGTIGYTVDQGYVDYLSSSFDSLAKDLSR